MKKHVLLLLIVFVFFALACNSQKREKENSSSVNSLTATADNTSDRIDAYYFHFTARCVTCRTIEESTKSNLQALYPEHIRSGLITFKSFNLDNDSCRVFAGTLGVSGQTLLLVKGDQKINLTNEGFMYSVSKPDKFRDIINEKVEFLLSR
ncbi:MAG TPA: nitrophenyl compound nitroreductase subunit ArsF family protein [Bacteroidales bacterium]|nr:nitrophenyl compound nitroreductase subunit ArsF family protein [Bacteroidales bacterium]